MLPAFQALVLATLFPLQALAAAQGRGNWGYRPPPPQPVVSPVPVVQPAASQVAGTSPTETPGGTTNPSTPADGSCPGGVQVVLKGDFGESMSHGYSCSGSGPSQSCCLQGSGAWFIPSPSGGTDQSTIIECTISGSGENWCNISVIDGYSVPIYCDIPSQQFIGGKVDFYSRGNCPTALNAAGNCPNHGHTPPVDPFFKPPSGSSDEFYYYQDDVGQVKKWTGNSQTVTCTVGAVNPKRVKGRDVDVEDGALEARNASSHEPKHAKGNMHHHARRAHSRHMELASYLG